MGKMVADRVEHVGQREFVANSELGYSIVVGEIRLTWEALHGSRMANAVVQLRTLGEVSLCSLNSCYELLWVVSTYICECLPYINRLYSLQVIMDLSILAKQTFSLLPGLLIAYFKQCSDILHETLAMSKRNLVVSTNIDSLIGSSHVRPRAYCVHFYRD